MSVRKEPGTALANDATGEVVYTLPRAKRSFAICWLRLLDYWDWEIPLLSRAVRVH